MDSKYLNDKLAKYAKLQETLEKDVGRIVFPELDKTAAGYHFNASNSLAKDTGRITFNQLNPKNTRPDQNVKTIDPNKKYQLRDKTFSSADIEAKKVAQKLPDIENVRPRAEAGSKAQFNNLKGKEMSEGVVLSHPVDGSNLSVVKTPEVANKYAPSTSEHEGLHSLVNDTASLYGIPKEDIYDKMNSMTDSSYHPYISNYLESSGYNKESMRHELVSHMRDLLVSPQKRERVFEGVSEDKKRSAMKAIRNDFNKIRKWAKTITPERFYDNDLEKGVKQRKFPYNPERDTPTQERKDLGRWTEGMGDWLDREALAKYKMHPNAFKRAMIDLSAKTDSRLNEHGEREYLLHRGMGETEIDSRRSGKNLGAHSSWTPNKDIAQEFADHDDDSVMSSWVPESSIHYVPNNIGHPTGTKGVPTEPYHKREHEIIVKPHDFKYTEFKPDPLNDESLHGVINSRKIGTHNSPKNLLERRRNKPKDWGSDDLEKDVGRVTFPELDPKLTRPDQEVKTIDPSKKYKIKETDPLLAGYGDGTKKVSHPYIEGLKIANKLRNKSKEAGNPIPSDHMMSTMSLVGNKIADVTGTKALHDYRKTPTSERETQGVNLSSPAYGVLGSYKSKEFENDLPATTREHEGLHHLVANISSTHKLSDSDIYNKMNSHIHPEVKSHLDNLLKKRGYQEGDYHREYVSHLRDVLTNRASRNSMLGNLPDEERHKVTTQMKRDFKKIRNWAKTAKKKDI